MTGWVCSVLLDLSADLSTLISVILFARLDTIV